jgi:hypothetical protein
MSFCGLLGSSEGYHKLTAIAFRLSPTRNDTVWGTPIHDKNHGHDVTFIGP